MSFKIYLVHILVHMECIKLYIVKRHRMFYYRRRVPLSIVDLCGVKHIHRPLSTDRSLAKKLATNYNNLFNMIDISIKLGKDVSNLLEELKLTHRPKIDIYEQYIQSKQVSKGRVAKIRRFSKVLKVLLPNDFSTINMSVLDRVKAQLIKLPKMNIQKYRVTPIQDLIKMEIPEGERQSVETVNGYLKLLNALIKFAYEREIVRKPYSISLVPKTHSQREERDALNINEIADLIHNGIPKLVPMYRILFYSGMRLSEVYKCKISIIDGEKCFDLTNKDIDLKTKSSYRYIPVHFSLLNEVENLLEQAQNIKSGYVIRKTSEHFHTKGKTLYSIRHGFATILTAKEVDSVVLSELMGHTHSGMTAGRYVKGYPVHLLRKAINKLPLIE